MKGNRLKALLPALLGGLALFLASCQQTQADRVLSVTVTPATATIEVGGQVALTAQVQVTGNASTAVTWSSSDTAVATVDANGVVRGVAPGQAIIRATSQADSTKFGQATITVNPADRPNISILAPANGAQVAGNFQATVRVQGSAGSLTSLTYTFAGGSPVSVLAAGIQPQQYDVTRTFTVNVPANLADGSYQLTVRAEDSRGRSAEASVTVQLRRGPRIEIQLEPQGANSNLVVLQQRIGNNPPQDIPYVRGNIQARVVVDGRGLTPNRVEIFRGRTEADTSTRLYDGAPNSAQVVDNTALLPQGEVFFYIARVYFDQPIPGTNPPQNNRTVAQIFVPDNLPPQLPDIVEVSKLSPARTAARGNWVNGTFTQQLENLSSLVDNPTGTTAPASGVRAIRYFADRTPFDGTFDRDILLGEALTSPYSIQVNTNQVLPDGTYRIFAVAVDQLGNESTGPLSAYILNVDNTPPQVALTARDRSPGDVNATTACGGDGNVDLFPAEAGFISGCAVVSARAQDTGVGFFPGTTQLIVSLGGGSPAGAVPFPNTILAGPNPNDPVRGEGTVNYNAVNGPVTLTATISDELGNQGQATFQATVDNNRPQAPVITSPSSGTYDAWSQVSFGANSSDSQSQVRELRLFFASNADGGVAEPIWNPNRAAAQRQAGLVELARIPGASGTVNVRLPDPTNEAVGASDRSLELIALAVDQAGNAQASYRSLNIRHVAAQANTVNNNTPPAIGADLSGNNNRRFELTFLAPPSGTPYLVPALADPGLPLPVRPLAGLIGQSQYILSYLDLDASGAIREGALARLSFYYLAPNNDPLRASLGTGGTRASQIGLPGYADTAGFNEVYNLIQDVESSPFQVNWTLEPSRGLVALIFNDRGHSSYFRDVLAAGFMVRATALACPGGPYSILANQPIVATYQVEWYNAPAGANVEYEMRYQRVVPAGGTATLPNSNSFGSVQTRLALPADPRDGSGLALSHLDPPRGANDLSRNFDPNPPVNGPGTGTYRQILAVRESSGPVERTFALCPTFEVNP
jgi:hypothetical protein